MTVFMVERGLKGIAMEDLAAAQKAAIATAEAMRDEGSEARYMHSSFVPRDGRCICFFEGESADTKSGPSTIGPGCPTAA